VRFPNAVHDSQRGLRCALTPCRTNREGYENYRCRSLGDTSHFEGIAMFAPKIRPSYAATTSCGGRRKYLSSSRGEGGGGGRGWVRQEEAANELNKLPEISRGTDGGKSPRRPSLTASKIYKSARARTRIMMRWHRWHRSLSLVRAHGFWQLRGRIVEAPLIPRHVRPLSREEGGRGEKKNEKKNLEREIPWLNRGFHRGRIKVRLDPTQKRRGNV